MIWFGKYLTLVLVLLSTLSALAGDDVQAPEWPLDLSTRYLTSNFMEYRGGRFHAGLDLKTQSREGFTVRAVEDGYISRVRCTPTAYGRVVYMRGVSGKTFVFAHLARFSDDLRERIEQAQQQSGTYRARLEFKAGQIPITKGQVLGLSGQSGTGGPHLHFEVRDRNQRPMNPLEYGFTVTDTFPPVILNLRAWPASEGSTINGQKGEWVLHAPSGAGLSGDLGVLNITGPVAFSSRMVDASDIRGHKLEPWIIELTVDDELVYRCRNDRYSFDENALQRLEWTDQADWTEEGVPREHWLHRRPANTLTGREGDLWYLGSGHEGLAVGDHEVILRVMDYAGGEASVRWTLRVQDQPSGIDSNLWRQHYMGLTDDGPAPYRLTPFFSTGNASKAGFTVLKLDPSTHEEVLESVELWVQLMETEYFLTYTTEQQGLKVLGKAVVYMAADWPIESSVPVFLPGKRDSLPDAGSIDSAGVYRINRKGKWELVSMLADPSTSEFLLEEPGIHAVLQDSLKPVFMNSRSALLVQKGTVSKVDGVTFPKWKLTPVLLDDFGSGIDTGSIGAMLDGNPLIVEPDSPRGRLLVHWPDSMTAGAHLLVLNAGDKAGNTATATYKIQAQEDSP